VNVKEFVALVKMGRPFILVAGLIAYVLGLSMAYYQLHALEPIKAVMGLLIMVSAIFMAHYANEYADVDTDSLTRRTWFSGGSGVLPSEIIPRSWALYAAILFALLSLILTVLSLLTGILPIPGVFIVAMGMLGGWFYSMPPLRLERTVWGELDNALLGGFLMPLIAYVPQTGYIDLKALLILIPIFLAVMVNLLAVHWADRNADAAVGKNTLVVRLGNRTRAVHAILTAFIYLSSAGLIGVVAWPVFLAIFLTLPLAIWAVSKFEQGPLPSSFLMVAVMIFSSVGFLL
jgi:1,4-dihydroxy-2-naphthoate polyprenyltransferase